MAVPSGVLAARPATATAAVAVAVAVGAGAGAAAWPCALTRHARTGSGMFLTVCSPWSSKLVATLPRTAPRPASESVMPPGSASPSSCAAMLTPSP